MNDYPVEGEDDIDTAQLMAEIEDVLARSLAIMIAWQPAPVVEAPLTYEEARLGYA